MVKFLNWKDPIGKNFEIVGKKSKGDWCNKRHQHIFTERSCIANGNDTQVNPACVPQVEGRKYKSFSCFYSGNMETTRDYISLRLFFP
jgi:hypothetical protein